MVYSDGPQFCSTKVKMLLFRCDALGEFHMPVNEYEIEVVLENGVLSAHMDAKRLVIDTGSPSSLGSDEIIGNFGERSS